MRISFCVGFCLALVFIGPMGADPALDTNVKFSMANTAFGFSGILMLIIGLFGSNENKGSQMMIMLGGAVPPLIVIMKLMYLSARGSG